jgi:hypothetical protein
MVVRNVFRFSIVIALLALSSCSKESDSTGANPLLPTPRPPYAQNSPENALRLLEWGYSHKNLDSYQRLFTSDFRFVFSDLDSSGVAYRVVPWTREDELISANHLFHGGDADQPAATDIRLTLNRNFLVLPDDRAGKNPGWHSMTTTQLILHVLLSDGYTRDVTGEAKFYLTRADSALIPNDLGAPPDSTTWYIDRWEDMTAQGGGLSRMRTSSQRLATPATTMPARKQTWGEIKVWYR